MNIANHSRMNKVRVSKIFLKIAELHFLTVLANQQFLDHCYACQSIRVKTWAMVQIKPGKGEDHKKSSRRFWSILD